MSPTWECAIADPYVEAPFLAKFNPIAVAAGLRQIVFEGIPLVDKEKFNQIRIMLMDHHPRTEKIIGNDTEPTVFGGYNYSCASFRLQSLPSCCGVLVSHDSYVVDAWRGKGLGNLMQDMKTWLGETLKIGKMIATVHQGNAAEEHLLRKYGWRPGEPFLNHRSGSTIIEWEKVFR